MQKDIYLWYGISNSKSLFYFKGLCLFHEHGGHGHSHGHTQDRGTHSHISALANRYVCCHCKTNPAVI